MPKLLRVFLMLCVLVQTGVIAPAMSDTVTSDTTISETRPFKPSYRFDQYRVLQQRIPFLQERLLSQNPRIRYKLVGEVSSYLPLPEAERLLRQMMQQDDYEITQEQALMVLLSSGYKIDRSELPKSFKGIDRTDAKAVKDYLDLLRGDKEDERDWAKVPTLKEEGPRPGSAARNLGVVGDESDIARLKPLLNNANIYVRFSAAIALINLGDVEAGKSALAEIGNAPVIPENLFYIRHALLSLYRLGNEAAMQQFVAHLRTLEQSKEGNAQDNYVTGMNALASLYDVWQNDAQEWQEWLRKRHR